MIETPWFGVSIFFPLYKPWNLIFLNNVFYLQYNRHYRATNPPIGHVSLPPVKAIPFLHKHDRNSSSCRDDNDDRNKDFIFCFDWAAGCMLTKHTSSFPICEYFPASINHLHAIPQPDFNPGPTTHSKTPSRYPTHPVDRAINSWLQTNSNRYGHSRSSDAYS